MMAEEEAAEMAAELALYQNDEGEAMPMTPEQRNQMVLARHKKRLDESTRLQAVREMRDTLSNSALEAVLVDEIADVEREIREMHLHRQKLHDQLQQIARQRAALHAEIEGQKRQIDGAEIEVQELQKKKEELANIEKLGNVATDEIATPQDRKPLLQKEKIELDTTVVTMQKRLLETTNKGTVDPGELKYLEDLIGVLKARQNYIDAELTGAPAGDSAQPQDKIQKLKQQYNAQQAELEELRRRVADREAQQVAAQRAANNAG